MRRLNKIKDLKAIVCSNATSGDEINFKKLQNMRRIPCQ